MTYKLVMYVLRVSECKQTSNNLFSKEMLIRSGIVMVASLTYKEHRVSTVISL